MLYYLQTFYYVNYKKFKQFSFQDFFVLEIVSIFILFNSVFSFLYTVFCYKAIEIYYTIKIDFFYFFSPDKKFIYSAYYEQVERFKFFLGYWALQFEFVLFFSLFVLLFYWCYFLFHKVPHYYSIERIAYYLIFIIFLLEFYVLFHFYLSVIMNLKFFYLNNSYLVDNWVLLVRGWVCIFSQLFLVFYRLLNNARNVSIDFFFLLVFGIIFSWIVPGIIDIFLNFVLLEILSIVIITLIVFNLSSISLEAGIKYFVFNTTISGLSVFGIFIIFFLAKNSNFSVLMVVFNYGYKFDKILIIIGLLCWLSIFLFKLNLFPFCFYLLEVYESLSFNLIMYLFSIIKISILFMLCKVYFIFKLSELNIIFFIFGLLSMVISGIMAIRITKVKRFFALTSINLNGFLLICIASNSLFAVTFSILYLFIYNLLSYLMFFKISSIFYLYKEPESLLFSNLYGMLENSDFFKSLLLFFILSISGLPPSIIFMYKYVIFLSLFAAGYYVIMFLLICINLFGFYYYLVLVKYIVVDSQDVDNIKYASSTRYGSINNIKANIFFNYLCVIAIVAMVILFLRFDQSFLCVKTCGDSLLMGGFICKIKNNKFFKSFFEFLSKVWSIAVENILKAVFGLLDIGCSINLGVALTVFLFMLCFIVVRNSVHCSAVAHEIAYRYAYGGWLKYENSILLFKSFKDVPDGCFNNYNDYYYSTGFKKSYWSED